jgi:hypothetical protein
MEPQSDALTFQCLERRLRRSERWTKLSIAGWGATLALLLATHSISSVHARDSEPDKLRVRQLTIVDDKGRERIVIAAPLPDPVVQGKVQKRIRVVAAGVQFKAADGTERGGIAASDDGSFMFGIDDEVGRERAHLYYLPKRGSGVYLQGENNRETVSLLIPNGGQDPQLIMTNQSGNSTAQIPAPK